MITKAITVKFEGKCKACGGPIPAGTMAQWSPALKTVWHPTCVPAEGAQPPIGNTEAQGLGKPVAVPYQVLKAKTKAKAASLKAKPKPAGAGAMAGVQLTAYHDNLNQGPATQKAKGIKVLQDAGMLSHGFASIAFTEDQAVQKAQALGLPCFVRPCPVTPRHGFVDSRVVKTLEEVRGVWNEARAEDPQAELIVMPFIESTHNMVWRPGLLSVGPGHDGATAGHDSISVFLQPGYSDAWKKLAQTAGVKPDQDPFIEAVCGPAHDVVVTQIRGGVQGTVTAPDWVPDGMTVGEVIIIDQATKNEPGKMLAWETECKALKPGFHVVYNPGGNLGDHYTVHAQLANIAVVSTFKPTIGQVLPKMGIELVPLEPQAIVFGFLGGILGPSLKTNLTARRQAVCAAVMGTHHGLRMGGDAGVFIGASVAFMLRLGQAAIWGEARHAEHAGLSREYIFQDILDDWLKGRQGLEKKVKLFHTHKWGGGFGGQAWAACGHGLVDLDKSILDLVRIPSRVNAKKVLGALTTVVNLAHNNGWWMNKFTEAKWFDLAADLDPRVALMAGPVWYDSATVPAQDRMTLLAKVEALEAISLGKFDTVTPKGKVIGGKPKKIGSDDLTPISMGGHGSAHVPKPPKPTKKIGNFGAWHAGALVDLPFVPVSALAKADGSQGLHVQLQTEKGQYQSGEITDVPQDVMACVALLPTLPSASGSGVDYKLLPVGAKGIQIAGSWILQWAK